MAQNRTLICSRSSTNAEGGNSLGSPRVTALPLYTPTNPDGTRKNYIKGITRRSDGFYHPQYYADTHPNNSFGDDFLPTGYLTIEPIKNLIFKTQGGVQYSYSELEQKELPSFIDYRFLSETNPYSGLSTTRSLRKSITIL